MPSLLENDEHAYVEYTTDREGSVKGVCVTRQAMLAHCRAIVAAMSYKEGMHLYIKKNFLTKTDFFVYISGMLKNIFYNRDPFKYDARRSGTFFKIFYKFFKKS